MLTELALARLLERGGYDRHLRRQRRAYRRRRQIVIDVMESEVPGAHVSGVEAGLHALVTLPPAMADDAVVEGAARRGVAIERLRTFAATPQAQPDALVLGYAALAEPTLRAGLAELVAAIEAQAGDGSRGSGRGSAGQRERPGAATETDPSGGAAARRVVDTGGEPVGA